MLSGRIGKNRAAFDRFKAGDQGELFGRPVGFSPR
jgi:hypothetical protein